MLQRYILALKEDALREERLKKAVADRGSVGPSHATLLTETRAHMCLDYASSSIGLQVDVCLLFYVSHPRALLDEKEREKRACASRQRHELQNFLVQQIVSASTCGWYVQRSP